MNNTHMVFYNKEHEKFYYEKLGHEKFVAKVMMKPYYINREVCVTQNEPY